MANPWAFSFMVQTAIAVISLLVVAAPAKAAGRLPSDDVIAREVVKDSNKLIIEEFLKQELREVNDYAAKPLLKDYPSLSFFIKQVDKGPFESLLFLEGQVHNLRKAQKNIDSFPYSISFSSEERKKILGLRPLADRLLSYGIPLMKRDLFRILEATKALADKRRKHPMELIPDPGFRDAVYRYGEPTADGLDTEMAKISEGEEICMGLGWTLEQVTVTRLWLVFNDNTLPLKRDYMAFRKKRSEYFQHRLKRIYGDSSRETSTSGNRKLK